MNNREVWLTKAASELSQQVFLPTGHVVPKIRVSTGFSGTKKRNTLGSCWHPSAAEDKVSQIFISPTINDSMRVLDVLAHEIIHSIESDAGHRKAFKRIALSIGLTGKMTATIAGPELIPKLQEIKKKIGEYPHAKLATKMIGGKKTQTTRLKKAICPHCGYTVRITKKWLELGLPLCPCGVEMKTENN